jgi:uroporphyrin-III C-methyltransferase
VTSEAKRRLPPLEPGSVWLVGAGPGDPGLLTLLALHALEQADIIVHDALVGPGVLALAGQRATLESAGKRGGRPSPSQPDISRRLVDLARTGARVLRLKGGDPFVFGRGGEEALALRQAGIPFRVVPGITAGIGGLGYAGIPVTFRGIGQAVTFVTAHDMTGELPSGIDWSALARVPTLVCYMASRQLAAIAERLIAHGRPAGEALAVVSRASLPDQAVIETTLGQARALAAPIAAPAMIVVGEVVRLRAELDWFSPALPAEDQQA